MVFLFREKENSGIILAVMKFFSVINLLCKGWVEVEKVALKGLGYSS